MLDKFIQWAKKGEQVVRILKATLAGIEAFQKELRKNDSPGTGEVA